MNDFRFYPNYLMTDAHTSARFKTNKHFSLSKEKLLFPRGNFSSKPIIIIFLLCATLQQSCSSRQTFFRRRWSPWTRSCSRCRSTGRRWGFRLSESAPRFASFWPTTCSRTCIADNPDSSTAAEMASRWPLSTARWLTWGWVP